MGSQSTVSRAMRAGWLVLLGALATALGLWWRFESRREHQFDPIILDAARRAGLDPTLVKAVVWKESHFNERARGQAGELGLMQLMDAAAQEWAASAGVYPLPLDHLLDPRTNTIAGAWYLARLVRRYQQTDNPWPYALADYNAGRGNVLKWLRGPAATNSAAFIEAIGFPATKRYVREILARRERFARDFPVQK